MTTSPEKVRPLRLSCEGKCAGKNDTRTEELRRALQGSLTYGGEPWLARESGVCISSVRHQVEGEQRLSAPLLRAALRLRSPEEQAELLSLWLGTPLEHRP